MTINAFANPREYTRIVQTTGPNAGDLRVTAIYIVFTFNGVRRALGSTLIEINLDGGGGSIRNAPVVGCLFVGFFFFSSLQ